MLFREGPSHEVVEADADVHLELDEKGRVMGIEIWNAEKSGLMKQVAKAVPKQPSLLQWQANRKREFRKKKAPYPLYLLLPELGFSFVFAAFFCWR
jgi:uncharacterized protein YuzE